MSSLDSSISIVIAGQAGLGIQTIEKLLIRIFKDNGFNVYATKEYMSRVRGGSNSTQIRISTESVRAPIERIDIAVPLDKDGLWHIEKRISQDTLVFAETKVVGDFKKEIIDIPFSKMAEGIGNKIYANSVAAGFIAAILGVGEDIITECMKTYFKAKSKDIIEKNSIAADKGIQVAEEMIKAKKISLEKLSLPEEDPQVSKQILINGAESIGLGALAGGCNFVSSYPMSPSTGVLVFISQRAHEFGVIAEQAEDEIAAINMAIGAWYAGARALVTTSGGGFALMTEGVSLAGMIESPVVIHLAQRPGPATGLPTRTEQADLELALYSGHGEFPRIIFAPGSVEDAFFLAQRAFNMADKYQVPVFILTDQYLMDSYYNETGFTMPPEGIQTHIIKTDKDYKRYLLGENPISPRGIPGQGEGLVLVDSDEHGQYGRITESMEVRKNMVDKRLKKLNLLKEEALAPQLVGNPDYKKLVICWGSTFNIVKEAIEALGFDDVSMLHYKQVYPLHKNTVDHLKKAEKAVIVESNATSQLAKLIRLQFGIEIEDKILKYNGLAFYVEELVTRLNSIL